jgi:two-component system, NtrC family, nitrogen regulation sensor histidine kinase NtrY
VKLPKKFPTRGQKRLYMRFRLWSRRVKLSRKLAFSLATASVISGIATVATMTGTSSGSAGPDPQTVLALLYLDVVLLLLLGAVVARRVVSVWAERRRGRAGAGLHIRLVVLFSLLAITPAILVTIFSGLFLNFGIQGWFNERVSTAIKESSAVAGAYLQEHRKNIRSDILATANDLNRNAPLLMRNPERFNQVLSAQADLRSLSEALVIDSGGRVLARSRFSLSLEFELVPPKALALTNQGKIALLTSKQDDKVRAVVKLDRFVDAFLIVGRFVDSRVLGHIERTQRAGDQYKRLEERQEGIQITFVLIFVVVALLLLLAAVWTGMSLATRLVRPISRLIEASDQVRKGDLGVRVDSSASTDEIGTLSRAFNRMTDQLENQQRGLVEANDQLDERRKFTETVLAGVSAGVLGLDEEGRINLPNRSASELLGINLKERLGQKISDVIPEMADLFAMAKERPERLQQAEITLIRNDHTYTLLTRIAAEVVNVRTVGYVATFDDVTELLSAQRKAAWADIARRIAHEIKNPLTPIQLSAERLKRKYLKEITSDPETFSTCTDTIIRQVGTIGNLVSEFSSFARMPQPTLKEENLSEICRQTVFLEKNRHPDTVFSEAFPKQDAYLVCDEQQVAQALTNLFKNAAESIEESRNSSAHSAQQGLISFSLAQKEGDDGNQTTTIVIEDNGKGLPEEGRDRLHEPYVTTRDRGTGLGLAIVKKIMEDHNGNLLLENGKQGGARASLVFNPLDFVPEQLETPPQPQS